MKKKIKDITLGELVTLCKMNPLLCTKCPLYNKFNCLNFSTIDEESLNKEVDLCLK